MDDPCVVASGKDTLGEFCEDIVAVSIDEGGACTEAKFENR